MTRVLAVLRSPAVRWGFLAVALGFVVWFVVGNAAAIGDALQALSAGWLAASAVLSIGYVALTLIAWRRVLLALGHDLSARAAVSLFGVSQLGKYIPGGVWNVAAAAELGRAHRISARDSVAAMSIALLVSILTGVVIGAVAFFASPGPLLADWGWVLWCALPLLVLLWPPVTNRLIALAMRMTRRDGTPPPISTAAMAVVIGWSTLAWLVAGLSVTCLVVGLGAPLDAQTVAQTVGGYALAWVAGFVVVVAPAGAGVREVVLGAALAGSLPTGAVVAAVLLSRAVLTVVDLLFAGVGALELRRRHRGADDLVG